MEGNTKKEGYSQVQTKKPLVFHSQNIADTKAKEKREVFTKVEEKKTLRQSAEEFQKKFAEAKAHAAESRAKIENPGADENGVIRSHTGSKINWKLVRRIAIPILIVGGLVAAVYFNWGTIHHEFFEVSESRAKELIKNNPQKSIEIYDKLISDADTEDKKIELLYNRMAILSSSYGDQFSEQIINDAYKAYNILPCYETASQIAEVEEKYGSSEKAAEWSAKLENLEKEGIVLGNG